MNTHILVTDGCFYGDGGMFRVAPPLELKKLEALFRRKVFRMLLDKGKITEGGHVRLSFSRFSIDVQIELSSTPPVEKYCPIHSIL